MALGNSTYASHFRGGAISWQAQDLDNDGAIDDAVITVKTAWRSDFISGIGLSISPAGPSSNEVSESVVFVGGSETEANSDYAFKTTVIEVFNLNIGTEYSANFSGAARIASLENNSRGNWNIQTSIQLADGNLAPSLEFPIIYEVPKKNPDGSTLADWTFDVDALDQNADSVQYRLANNGELGGGSSTNLAGLSIDPDSGLITWSGSGTRNTGLYSGGIVAEDIDSNGTILSKSHVDFLLDLRNASALQLNAPAQISDSRNEIVEKGTTSSFSFDDSGINVVALGDAQGALVETTPNNFTFTAGAAASPLAPGVYPVTFEVYDSADAFTNSYFSINFIIPDPDAPIISNLQDDRTPYSSPGSIVTVDSNQDASITDANNIYFDGGNLKLNLSNSDYANETLSINSVGSGVGEISVSGSSIAFEGVSIGTIDSTLNGVNNILSIDFTGTNVTLDAVATLIQELTYTNSAAAVDRDITIRLEDSDGLSNFYSLYSQAVSLENSTLTTTSDPVGADGSSTATITVGLFDSSARAFASSGGSVAISSDIGTVSAVTDNADGTYTASISSITQGVATLSATANGSALADTAQVTFIEPVAPASSTLSLSSNSAVVNTTTTIAVQAINASGGNVPFGGDTVAISTNLGTVSSVTDNSNGTYTATIVGTTTGTATISASINNVSTNNTETLTLTAGAASTSNSTLTTSAPSATTDDSVLVTVQLTDANGNNLTTGGDNVVLSTSSGTISSTTDVGNGTHTATLTNTAQGLSAVTASINNAALNDSENVTFSPGVAAASTSILSVNSTSATTDDVLIITLQARDANANTKGNGGDTVVFSTTLGAVSSAVDNNDGTYTAMLSSSMPGSAVVSVTLNSSAVSDTESVTFVAGAASAANTTLAVSRSTATTDDSVSVTVQAVDAQGNNRTTGGDTVSIGTTPGSISNTTDNANGTYTATLTHTDTGSVTLSATINSVSVNNTESVTFSAGNANASASALAASNTSPTTDESVTITLQAVDANGNNLTSGGSTVTFATNAGVVSAATDTGNGTYTATLTNTAASASTVTATLDGTALNDSENVTFSPGVAAASTSILSVNSTSATTDDVLIITLQTRDANANTKGNGGDTVVFSTTLGAVSGAVDNNDGTYTAMLSSSMPGSAVVSVTLNSSAVSDTESVTFVAGAASAANTTLAVSRSTATTDDSVSVTVQAVDAQGNNRTTGGDTVSIGTTPGSISNTTDNANGTYTATLTHTDTGSVTLSATINSVSVNNTESVTFSAGNANASASALAASNTSPTTDESVTITLQAVDANGNNLTSGGSTVTFATNAGVVSAATDTGNGTYTATLTNTAASASTVTATLDGTALNDSEVVTFSAGSAATATSALSASATTSTTDNTVTLTLQTVDAAGNPKTSGGDTVVFNTSLGTVTATTDNGNGTYTAQLGSASTGNAAISAALNGISVSDTETVTFSPGVAASATSTLSVSDATPTTDETVTITVQTVDAQGNNRTTGGDTVAISASAGTLRATSDNSDGTYTATLTHTEPASINLTASINTAVAANSATVTFSPGAADVNTSMVAVSATSATTDQTITVSVQAIDANGNPLSAGGDAFVLTSSSGTISATIDNNDGSYSASLESTAVGSVTVGATLSGSTIADSESVSFTPGTGTSTNSVLAVSDATPTTDDSVTITVQSVDAGGNQNTAGGAAVLISSTLGTVGPVTNHGDGTYSAILTSTSTGNATVSYTLDGNSGSQSEDVSFTVGAADPTTSVLTAAANEISTVVATTLTLQAKDQHGNDATSGGLTISFATDLGTVGADISDNADGTYTVSFNSDTAGTATITTQIGSAPVSSSVTVEVSPGIADVTQSTLELSPTSLLANGTDTSTITVQIADLLGNTLNAGGDSVSLSTTVGSISNVVDNDDGTYTATFTAPEKLGEPTTTAIITSTINNEASNQSSISLALNPSGDEDDDGVSNSLEGISEDTDNDGTPNYLDEDDDNDGISTLDEGSIDTDDDTTLNYLDTDSDNDGVPDIIEAARNYDGDELPNYLDTDSDNDGVLDSVETQLPELVGTDSDADGIDDALDVDATEGVDADENGIDDRFDVRDSDGDDIPDYLDIDSDNDGIPDTLEGSADTDDDGIADYLDEDSNNDGISDRVAANVSGIDVDEDGISDEFDVDNTGGVDENGDGVDDTAILADLDADGVPDIQDADIDGDGTNNLEDVFPQNSLEAIDSDNDGLGNNEDPDDDNDGYSDIIEALNGTNSTDVTSLPDAVDTDGDLIADSVERGYDSDGDGIEDYLEVDSDNDGIYDHIEGSVDTDTARQEDTDSDGRIDPDPTGAEPQLLFTVVDTDGDDIPDVRDLDSDNDGILDELEAAPERAATLLNDFSVDLFDDTISNALQSAYRDADNDAIENFRDLDSDNDNIPDILEAGGVDVNGDGRLDDFVDLNGDGYQDQLIGAPLPVSDTDTDSIRDFIDVDSDQDGLTDLFETAGADTDRNGRIDEYIDLDGDGWTDTHTSIASLLEDTDDDGILNFLDLDSDNDGVFDLVEAGQLDVDDNGVVDVLNDSDSDGIPNPIDVDVTEGTDANGNGIDDLFDSAFTVQQDTDNDGIPDEFDADANGDGLADSQASSEPGISAALPDSDNDGVPDVIDESEDTVHIGLSGSGCSIGATSTTDPLLWILLAFAAMYTAVWRRIRASRAQRLGVFLALISTVVAGISQADDKPGLYLGVGIAATSLKPEVEGSTFTVTDTSSAGWHVLLGYRFHRRWRAELDYADLGQATLSSSATLEYSNINGSILFDAWKTHIFKSRKHLTLFGRIGAGKLSGESDLNIEEDSSLQTLFGLGVDLSLSQRLSLRAELVSYDEDAKRAGLVLLYKFGGQYKDVDAVPVTIETPADIAPRPQINAEQQAIASPKPANEPAHTPELPKVRILDTVNFLDNSGDLESDEQPELDALAEEAKAANATLIVTGHTDSVGSDSYNQTLSQVRAQSVRNYLITRGISPSAITAIGRGESMPIAHNSLPEGRARNRRVEIEFIEKVSQ